MSYPGTSAAAGESYPSPQNNSLPFYEHLQNQPRPQNGADEQQQDGASDASEQEEVEAEAHPRAVPDDPQLRANLASLMGSFGVRPFDPTPQGQHAAALAGLPAGSIAFAQAIGSLDAAPPAQSKGKERTKTSRACDECRRKKIRCDAIDETGDTPCSNCGRTAAKCSFSRQPMKRGPSKGYIKELAERLNTLEQQVHPTPQQHQQAQFEIQQVQQAMAAEGYVPSNDREGQGILDPRIGEKRTREMVDGPFNTTPQAALIPQTNQIPRRPPQPTFQPSPIGRRPNEAQPFWSPGGVGVRQENNGLGHDVENSTNITSFDWDESVVDEYYRIIHQTFPLLPSNKNRLRQRLADCPASLREAFLVALDCLMRTFPTTSLPPNAGYAQALKKAAELLARYPFDNPSSHTDATNLVYLQTLLLMALESDNHGPATIRGQAGPSRAEWLGRAAGVAGQLEINVIRTSSRSIMEGDRDSEERLARRVWWVLFILDRWHASSTADLLKLPENSVVLLPEDQILLGESTYHLARLSFIIGHLAAILTTTKTPSTDVMEPSNAASSLLGLVLTGEIDRFRESVESVWGSLNLVHLSYHHCHLLIKRLSPTSEPNELVGHAVKVATVLNSRLTPVTPLNHHFAALAAMTLCELCDVPNTKAEALKGLEQLVECLGEGRGLAGRQESEGWDGAIRELVVEKKERMLQQRDEAGLQGLASAAGVTGQEPTNFDPTALTRYGYLTALGQGRFKSK